MKILGKRMVSILLIVFLTTSLLTGCAGSTREVPSGSNDSAQNLTPTTIEPQNTVTVSPPTPTVNHGQGANIDYLVYEKLFNGYSMAYDTFDAVIILPDGTELYGIAYCDYSCYFEREDKTGGYFPAGFLIDGGNSEISKEDLKEGLVIENLSYSDDRYGFVLGYETEPYLEHFVVDGKYVKYGVDDHGMIVHTECEYKKELVDTSLGALYSYDEKRYLYDPDVGDFKPVNGDSLYSSIDYKEIEAEVNRILEEQDQNFSTVEIQTAAHFSQDAVRSYLLSLQEETFLGYSVDVLVEEVSKLDPMECFRLTPEGYVVLEIESIPKTPSALAKWTVGISCGIVVAGSIALNVFVPATTPLVGAICGAAIDSFMQVVIENHAVEDINWKKVAVSATAGALMAWACPLGASAITQSVGARTGSVALSKLAGYGFLTISNSVVSGATNAAFTIIDEGSSDEIFNSFLIGAALGACCTVGASLLSEVGHAGMNYLRSSKPENWLVKLSDGASAFVGEHQVKLFSDSVENILSPKSVYEASRAGVMEYNRQYTLNNGKKGGSYSEVKKNSNGEYTHVHEMPSRESTGVAKRDKGPAIKMTKEDHRLTASYCRSREADLYRAEQKRLIEMGNYHDAIQMDIDDIHEKFGSKYDEAIAEMLEYAESIGWW